MRKDVSVLSLEENLMTQDESHWRKALFVQTVQKDIPLTKSHRRIPLCLQTVQQEIPVESRFEEMQNRITPEDSQ